MQKKIFFTVFLAVIFLLGNGNLNAKANKKYHSPIEKLSLNALKWRSIGPAMTSGRISDFAVNPQNSSEYYVAVASGGVWKTINAGTTFKPVFDKYGSYSIGCITMDPNNHSCVWVGTGENNNQRSVAYGDGIYKTEDGGKSWKNMGLKESEHIGMIVIDPGNSQHIYVAAYGPLWRSGGDRGLFQSLDGGKTWKQILSVSKYTGISEVHMDPRDSNLLYAVAHQRMRKQWTYLGGGPESAVYRSIDGGKTWAKIMKGLPKGDIGRIALAISPPNPDIVYAIVEAEDKRGGFFKSTDRGASWEKRSSYYSSGNYYQELVCDPKNPDKVFSLNVYLKVTVDGGQTWKNLGEKSKHIDNHAIWINPRNTDYHLVGSDGGVYESFDQGKNWKFMTNLPITQFYKVAVDNTLPFYLVHGGTQDNYSLAGPSRTISAHGIVTADWFTTQTADGFETAIDPKDPNIIYAQSQYGGLQRYDKRSGEILGIKPRAPKGEEEYNWNWDSPLLISPHNHKRLYFAANILFRSDDRGSSWKAVSGDLTRKVDRNKLSIMDRVWPIDAVAKNRSTSKYGAIVALDESPLQEGLIYVGTDDGLVQVTKNGGETWHKTSSFPTVPQHTYVNDIIASKHDKNVVYACFNNHKSGDFKPYVLKSSDQGSTWQPITANLPQRGTVYALEQDFKDANILFAGTEFGCFFSIDGGKYWKQLKNGLPTIAVKDMAIQERECDLVIATFGRGFYIIDDYSCLRHLSAENLNEEAKIFPIKEALMFKESYPLGELGSKSKGFQGEMYYSAPNPKIGAVFNYFIKDSVKTLKKKRQEREKELIKAKKAVSYPSYEELKAEQLEEDPYLLFTILDESDQVVRHLRSAIKKGVNQKVWDLTYPALRTVKDSKYEATKDGPSSTFVIPGTYKVKLSKCVNGQFTELSSPVTFTVKSLGHSTLPAKDKKALADFQIKVKKLNNSISALTDIVGRINNRIPRYKSALKSVRGSYSALYNNIKVLEIKLRGILIKLYGDYTRARLDKGMETGLVRRLRSVIYSHSMSTSAPTGTQIQNYQMVNEEYQPLLKQVTDLINQEIKEIEIQLKKLGAPHIEGQMLFD
jgi:photosystem II stability/assembly factor-like uncharacterized protein